MLALFFYMVVIFFFLFDRFFGTYSFLGCFSWLFLLAMQDAGVGWVVGLCWWMGVGFVLVVGAEGWVSCKGADWVIFYLLVTFSGCVCWFLWVIFVFGLEASFSFVPFIRVFTDTVWW